MTRRKTIFSLFLILFVTSLVLAGIIFSSRDQSLNVVFLDVGQGDAILISQGKNQILIDGGPNGQLVLEKLGRYVPFWDRQIEVVIATHPDQDHIDGLVDVMEKYEVLEIIDNGVSSDSQIYKKFRETIQNRNISEIEGKVGMKIKIGDSAELEILSPNGTQNKENPKDTNGTSIVSKLTYGESTFLFTGDLTSEQELELIRFSLVPDSRVALDSRVLKVGHHGSKYSTSAEFLEAVKPREAVISVGKNNRYGHPAPEIIDRLESQNIRVKRTDELGDIEYDLPKL